MDTMIAFAIGQMNKGRELMVFDWDKAARLIVEHKATSAGAGLSGDWDYTGGSILTNGEPDLESYTRLASTWATPELEIDGVTYDCFRMQSAAPEWDSATKWPPSALEILKGEGRG